jgi:hypothetical protein
MWKARVRPRDRPHQSADVRRRSTMIEKRVRQPVEPSVVPQSSEVNQAGKTKRTWTDRLGRR